ncbi:hypothetical protein [Actinomadura macrotermitis]|uniref:Secreted protein n=1 Tax=Actinomadura macrotermitis TaxID=2585200 RepID=A0A7K0BR64_9ACTN|nr:hypothetical protein [Actinomadura macrotermitis]MQY03670.1 hypothetical protein [Actinomadura macrotermitis]
MIIINSSISGVFARAALVACLSGAAVPAVSAAALAEVPTVKCTGGKGDVADLARALGEGGEMHLGKACDYRFTTKAGENTALPKITKNTTVHGHNSTISWAGKEEIKALMEVGPKVQLELENLRLAGPPDKSTMIMGEGASLAVTGRPEGQEGQAGKAAPEGAALFAPEVIAVQHLIPGKGTLLTIGGARLACPTGYADPASFAGYDVFGTEAAPRHDACQTRPYSNKRTGAAGTVTSAP